MKTNKNGNERVKRRYLEYKAQALRLNVASIDAIARSLSQFQEFFGFRDFGLFRQADAIAFKEYLSNQNATGTDRKLSKSTLHSTLSHLRDFFDWLADEPGYRSKLQLSHALYFNLSRKEVRVATTRRETPGPSLEMIETVLESMPHDTTIEKRDRALIAFIALTGARVAAIASLKLKHVDLATEVVTQDAREVNTKGSKSFSTAFFPIGGRSLEIFSDYIRSLTTELGWTAEDPLFPSTLTLNGVHNLWKSQGLSRNHWRSSETIRKIFREAFESASLPYFHPHSFRKTLVALGMKICRTAEDFKAWSQNLGHDSVSTTFYSYGNIPFQHQIELIRKAGKVPDSEDKIVAHTVEAVLKVLDRRKAVG